MSELLKALTSCLGAANVLLDNNVGERYASDWSEAVALPPKAVLRPSSTEQLSDVMAICHDHAQPIVVQGGLTGLAGGATPQAGEISISLERMRGIEMLDEAGMTMTAWAGTTLQELQEAALEVDLYLPLDLAARGSCNIGGNVATNAGGTEVIRYGMARALVLGLEVVLADGTVISSLNTLVKNNSGFDLKQLFIGSEGTLGIITRVVLRLQPRLLSTHTALCGLPDYPAVLALLNNLKRDFGAGMTGFEVMWDNYYRSVIQQTPGATSPFQSEYPFYVLIEYKENAPVAAAARFESVLCEQLEKGVMIDALIAQSSQDAAKFWQIRDGIGTLLKQLGPVSNQDVSLPIALIGEFAQELETLLKERYANLEILYFGHLGDNNMHAVAYTGRIEDTSPIGEDIMQMIGRYGGAVTAEHGIGVLKKKYLSLSRTDNEIALMKRLKQALDPHDILNRGRVI
ncbi:MAG TPA: FAD-binding oxidoreductase [Porticoccaceae bacterium]|nr:FAD-binding oxidoreductase [Porticoccaceae bacterium]